MKMDNKEYGNAIMRLWDMFEKHGPDNHKLIFTKVGGLVEIDLQEVEEVDLVVEVDLEDLSGLESTDSMVRAAKAFDYKGVKVKSYKGSYSEEMWKLEIVFTNDIRYEVVTFMPIGPGSLLPDGKDPSYAFIENDDKCIYFNVNKMSESMANWGNHLPFELGKQAFLIPKEKRSEEFKNLIR